MKHIYSSVVALGVFVVFAAVAGADPRTTWENQIDRKTRFRVLNDFNDAAVLDRETGLVWEQSPDTSTRNWFNALVRCYQLEVGVRRGVGGRKGWRLPTIEELASLVDTSERDPALPAGNPFSNVQQSSRVLYWSATSATTSANDSSGAWGVFFNDGLVFGDFKSSNGFVWCVRGGQGVDGVQ
jgi:hypothetical protein